MEVKGLKELHELDQLVQQRLTRNLVKGVQHADWVEYYRLLLRLKQILSERV